VIVLIGVFVLSQPSHDGPLRSSSLFRVTEPAAPDEIVRFEASLPANDSGQDIRIERIELVNVYGLDVVGSAVTHAQSAADGTCVSSGYGATYPPPGYETREIAGAILPTRTAQVCGNVPFITIGVKRSAASSNGGIDDVRVYYEFAGRAFVVDLRQSLVVIPR